MSSATSFTEKLLDSIRESGEERTFSKGDFLLKEGQVERNLYFIESGAIRIFHLYELEEQTIRFGYEGSITTSLSSFLQGKPSEFYMEAIRKTTVRLISKEKLMELVTESEESLIGYSSFLEMVISQQIEREIDLLTISPTDRLRRVLERSPNLFQQIPLKYIASYLRMKPETLSRIRNS